MRGFLMSAIHSYKTRRYQLDAFLREIVREHPTTLSLRRKIGKGLRDAAMVGACEERHRTLEILRRNPPLSSPESIKAITGESVEEILGF